MSEEGMSAFEAAKFNLERSISLGSASKVTPPDKIVYEIPDDDMKAKIPEKPMRKYSNTSPVDSSPLVPPRPFEEGRGKYHHKAAPPTPEEVEPVEKKPIKLNKIPKYNGKSMKLQDFMEKFRAQFPIAVKVSRGFYGDSELYTLSEGEKFIICFLTDYETVCGVEQNGSVFEIPVNQNYLISLLSERMEFDPRTQETITSLLSLNPTPKRVAARNNFTRNGVTVKIGDLLDVISINYDEDSGMPLNVIFKTMEGKEVHFNEHDTEQFSLRLSLTSEKLETGLKKCVFPQRVYLYPQNKNKYTSNNKPYTLLEMRKGQMFISYVYEDKITYVGPDNIDDTLVEIPIDLDIEVEVLGKPVEKLYETKEEIYSAFKDVRKLIRKEEDYDIAANYMKDKTVDLPSHKVPGARFLSTKALPSDTAGMIPKKEFTKVNKQLSEEKRRNGDLNRMAQKLDDIISDMTNKMGDLSDKCSQKDRYIKELLAERDLPPLPNAQRSHSMSTSELSARYNTLPGDNYYTQVDEPSGQLNPFSTVPTAKAKNNQNATSDKPNDKKVEEYTVQDVKELLENLKMSQYVDKFMEEGVNGEILSVLDESILENDLGITSGLHKKKILKVIDRLTSRQDISHYMPMEEVMSLVKVKKPEKVYQQL